jgi:glycosyltransferase involved in cell wall biosynthesis
MAEGNGAHDRRTTPRWLARACVVVPAYDAASTLGGVIDELRRAIPSLRDAIFVVDDGSADGTADVARDRCVKLLSHPRTLGKGEALRTAFAAAQREGFDVALTVDADGQHLADEARRVLLAEAPADAMVLGVRALSRDGAPKKNQLSNGISNWFLSRFARRSLRDTQCGLRRYPIARTLGLGARGRGYDFEAEVLLRACWAGVAIAEEPVRVLYPEDRKTHFDSVRDPMRIIRSVVRAGFDRFRGRA